jgi:hypothetical protein
MTDGEKTGAQIFKTFKDPRRRFYGIDCLHHFASLSSHGAINCPIVSYKKMSLISEFLKEIAQFTVWAREKNCYGSILGSFSIPGIDFSPLYPSKKFSSVLEFLNNLWG